ncbi:DNA polymerase-1 [Thermomonospora echinospora]|uniref:DNA-directed DNA polymerase n=1 Tax=Thermomonospora echinospora TaxID=1992 RepID=A0A1H5X8J0_9ACTN|nr:bifunctional 3'-5' exonuclease/DNA polymerase [Thermomonospora echinospora]SEG07765.1 DNA polymerase-1 [Thermomonospora echinospora]
MAVTERADGGGMLRPLADDGTPTGPAEPVADLAAAIAARERSDRPRWVWAATARLYPRLLASGVRVARCHDAELVETLLLGYAGRYGEPRSVPAAWARLRGEPVPEDAPPPGGTGAQPALFEESPPAGPCGEDDLDRLIAVHADQVRRLAAAGRLSLLAAAESAGALVAAEMTRDGLPWRVERHDALLTELLGSRPAAGLRPRRLQDLADQIGAAFGARQPVNPDSPGQLLKAFAAAGLPIPSTRAHVLKRIDHPAVPLLLEYKELARLHAAHGWAWLDTWVRDGRFRPEYVVGGVVSGRWATRGGGALQIPRVLRRAVVADPGWSLVVADAAQLEPRVLAALAGDHAFAAAAAQGDLYAALSEVFGGRDDARDKAKIALLSAMYGGGGGEAAALLAILRHRFPEALGHVEAAARDGEAGRLVRSALGRTCPPPSAAWRDLTATGADERAGSALRSRGRFTRNFVVQASAADWALVLLALLRGRLRELAAPDPARRPHLVFFQHDEVIVHTPGELAEDVAAAIGEAGAQAGRMVFGPTPVVFPLETAVVDCYADAK